MPTFQVKVTDTITYEREAFFFVDADNAEAAKEKAIERACAEGMGEGCEETQIDNTPFEAEIEEEESED